VIAVPVASYLHDFRRSGPVHPSSSGPSIARWSPGNSISDAVLAAEIAAAEARGREEGRSTAEAEMQERLAEAERRFEERIAAERLRWTTEESEQLCGEIGSAVSQLGGGVAEAVARILAPFVSEAVRAEAVAELAKATEALLSNSHDVRLRISGPGDLLEALGERLGDTAAGVQFVPGPVSEVRVVGGSTLIETQLRAWAERLQQALR
jgi:hypothetical protein